MSDVPGRAFRNAFARRSVEAMADRRSFERGVLYAANGRVGKRTVTASSVKAKGARFVVVPGEAVARR